MFFFRKPVFFLSIFLIPLVSISGWLIIRCLEQQVIKEQLPQNLIINRTQDLHYDKISKQGKIIYSAVFKSTTRYVNANNLLHDIATIFYNQKQMETHWYITSNYAKTTNKNDKIILYDTIVIEKKYQDHDLPEIQITTEKMLYDNPNDTLSSDGLITIIKPGTNNTITGVGLLSYPRKGSFFLLSNVRSYFSSRKQ